MKLSKHLLAAGLTVLAGTAVAVPYPRSSTAPAALDLGTTKGTVAAPVSVTVALKLSNAEELAALIEATYTQGSPQYHHFLTPQQFRERFAPGAATLAQVTQHFEAAGLSVTRTATAQLRVSGSAAAIERAFGVELHEYAVAASDGTPAYRYRAPLGAPRLPAQISASVHGVFGLDTRPRFYPHLRSGAGLPARAVPQKTESGNPFGSLTVVDFAEHYDVKPLYHNGINGRGQTLAIVTLASFTPSDAFTYWASLGLNVRANRLKEVLIDGGSGPPSDNSGSLETTLDVEQSGGIAPDANVIVFEAPNTNQGFIDAFASVIDANQADSISTSWGEWEMFDTPDNVFDNGPVTDPVTDKTSSIIDALNDLLTQAALQGQTAFAAAGDAGAYDMVGELPASFSNVLSVDDPGVQPFITDAGGTTLPGPQFYALPSGKTLKINVPQERAWGWNYLEPLCKALRQTIDQCGIFPVGGGGGVSLYFRRPFYQYLVASSLRDSVPGQALYDNSKTPPQLVLALPGRFPGRNVPDISLNSDPQTGYVVAYTSNVIGFSFQTFWGGTSFASPQMNGVTALLCEGTHGRIGLLNVPLYVLAATNSYHGRTPPLRDIKTGDNWYWSARPGYDQASGVGVPDVANLLEALRNLGF